MKSIKGITQALIALFIVIIVIDILAVLADLMVIVLVNDVLAGTPITAEQANFADMFQGLTALLQTGFFIITSIVFLVWFYRAYKNIHSFGLEGIKHSPGWAVGYWFVPFLNFIRPYQIAQEIWRASESINESKEKIWRHLDVPPVIGWWWATFLGSSIIERFFTSSTTLAINPEEFLRSQWMWVVSDLFDVIAAYVAIRMVNLISDTQGKIQPNQIGSDRVHSLAT